jgi:hypothetical protein
MPEPGMSIAETEKSLMNKHYYNILNNSIKIELITFNVCRKITLNLIKTSLLQVHASPTFTLQQLCLITDTLHSKLQ